MKPRRKFTGEYKAKLVLEMLSGQRSVADIARKEGSKDTLLHEWRSEFIRNARRCLAHRRRRPNKSGSTKWQNWSR